MKKVVNHLAVHLALPSRRAITRPVGSTMFSEQAWAEIACRLKLSGRELQIVRGIFDDETDFCIAQRLGISLHTVHTHVERLHRKLAIMNRPQLLLLVVQEFMKQAPSPAHALPSGGANRASRDCPFSP